ncbi:AAA family ATPase, partial [Pseudomonas sp. 1]
MSEPVQFPLAAVVGADDLKLALCLTAIDPKIGGVLIEGPRGMAKSTLARGLADLLGDGPFVTLPLGATEERLVGTLDLDAALGQGQARFSPGVLAHADGGVLYVDEVNLLPDPLVDLLLDVAASGTNRIERDGISHRHAARFVLIGTMNPEEGELRPQLLDRFGLNVALDGLPAPEARQQIIRRRLAFDNDPEAFRGQWADAQAALRDRCQA